MFGKEDANINLSLAEYWIEKAAKAAPVTQSISRFLKLFVSTSLFYFYQEPVPPEVLETLRKVRMMKTALNKHLSTSKDEYLHTCTFCGLPDNQKKLMLCARCKVAYCMLKVPFIFFISLQTFSQIVLKNIKKNTGKYTKKNAKRQCPSVKKN